jgi:hypothetical protein
MRAAAACVSAVLAACASNPKPSSPTLPPNPLPGDGCTGFPDLDYRECCDRHDREYWCGGTREQRRRSDRALAECVRQRGHALLPGLVYLGVRIGGAPWWPTPWRWGFGWPYGRGYAPVFPGVCDG